MKSQHYFLVLWTVISSFGVAQTNFHGLDTNRLQDDFVQQNQQLKGDWKGGKRWRGVLCNGRYNYKIKAQGEVQKVDFTLSAEESMDVTATVVNAYGRVDGVYLSELTSCLPVPAWLGVGVDRIDLRSQVLFIENSSKLKVNVYYTRLGRLHVGSFVPRWVENMLTDAMNQALAFVWKTQLGDWLNAKISDYLNTKLPDSRI